MSVVKKTSPQDVGSIQKALQEKLSDIKAFHNFNKKMFASNN